MQIRSVVENGQLNLFPDERSFPGTKYMGSKARILSFIWESVKEFNIKSVLDAFSGSGVVSYLFKTKGLKVYSNDFLHFAAIISKALIENNNIILTKSDIEFLFESAPNSTKFIQETFRGLYFSDQENEFLDNVRYNIELLEHPLKKALALAALCRSCMKRRARGIFTFVGDRYDDGRRDLRMGLREHFIENIKLFNEAVFDNGKDNKSSNLDIFELDVRADLVYLDPPYYTPNSDNDYSRRYHFVEGLARNWQGLEIQKDTKTKKFKKYHTLFTSKSEVYTAFHKLFEKFSQSIIVLSYSSNSYPTKNERLFDTLW